MNTSGTIKIFSKYNVLLHQRAYYTREGRLRTLNEFLSTVLGKNMGCYYHLCPDIRIKEETVEPIVEEPPKPLIRP